MQLADAIRLGSLLRPQGFGVYYPHGSLSCALGAAHEALGFDPEFDARYMAGRPAGRVVTSTVVDARWAMQRRHMQEREQKWDAGGPALNACPCWPCGFRGKVTSLVMHLNDSHHWTREAIADHVAFACRLRYPEDAAAPALVAR